MNFSKPPLLTAFCTLAHLTYPLRYIKRDTGVIPNLSPYRDKIDLVYETLIKKDKALEINVSGLFKGLGETLPAFDEIKRYHDLGRQVHKPSEVTHII